MIKCVSKKESFKNLTVNKEYDGTEDGDMYVVTNDAGQLSKYAKKYFETVVVAPRSTPIAEAINVEITADFEEDDQITVDVTIGRHRTVDMMLEVNNTGVSCGIDEVTNISNLKSSCRGLYNRLDHNLYTGNLDDLFRAVITPMIEVIKENVGACFVMSDAIRGGETSMNMVLTEMSNVHWSGINTNSGNEIILWVFGK